MSCLNKLRADLRTLIEQARKRVVQAIDTGMVVLYWHVGNRIRRKILGQRRAQYGAQIVVTLSRQLSWSHFLVVIPMQDELRRQFYAELCRVERWPVRMLSDKVQSMLYERTAIQSYACAATRSDYDAPHIGGRPMPRKKQSSLPIPETQRPTDIAEHTRPADIEQFAATLGELIHSAQARVFANIAAEMVQFHWQFGRHIVEFEQGGTTRAAYSTSLMDSIAKRLTVAHGRGTRPATCAASGSSSSRSLFGNHRLPN